MGSPSKRPTHTPEGLEFPYSHFGDTAKRTELLQDMGRILSIEPDTVINFGCGYDVTPSDAFPDARVVHVDITGHIVEFLTQNGFEAYGPADMPDDIVADLAISILAPAPKAELIAPGGVLIETPGPRYIPEGMSLRGLVEYVGGEPVVTGDPNKIEELWASDRDIHLVALTKDS